MTEDPPRPTRPRIGEYLRQVGLAERARPAGAAAPAPPKLYRASEIAEHLGITRQTLHNYVTIGLITEEDRTPGGQRLFDESVFGRLETIRRLKPMHSLREIRRLLADQDRPASENQADRGTAASAEPAPPASPSAADVIAPHSTDTQPETESRSREQDDA